VDAFYAQILHRAADPIGRAGWVRVLLAGASEADVGRAFVESPEYTATHADASSFATGLYTDLLGRTPAPTELAGLQQALTAGASRDAAARGFFTSPEYLKDLVDGFYTNFLMRPADAAGESAAVGALQGGASLETVADALLGSDEFFAQGV